MFCQLGYTEALKIAKAKAHLLIKTVSAIGQMYAESAEQAKITFFDQTVNDQPTILSWFMVCLERKNISLRKNCQQTNNTKNTMTKEIQEKLMYKIKQNIKCDNVPSNRPTTCGIRR